jgi:hypothetical protein
VRLAVLRRPRELGGPESEVKKPLALGVEEQVRLRVHLGQARAMAGVDLQAGEPAHFGLENHAALVTSRRRVARLREGRGIDRARFKRRCGKSANATAEGKDKRARKARPRF